MKILLVDDDNLLLEMYATKFKEDGWEVEPIKNIDIALDRLRGGETYDVAVFDRVMPGTDGLTFLKTIKEEKLGNGMKCIMLSNQSEEEDIQSAMDAGADGYIIKADVVPSEVVSKVKSLVS